MDLRTPISTSILNSLLLCVFLIGGVFSPTLHAVHHGLDWLDAASRDEVCDHSDHETGFEEVRHEFELDDCTSCVSRWDSAYQNITSSADRSADNEVWHDQTDFLIALGPYSSGARAPPAV